MLKSYQSRSIGPRPGRTLQYCVSCGGVATKEVLFRLRDFVALRRYCDPCSHAAECELSDV